MKAIIRNLSYDPKLVKTIKKSNVNKDFLYNQLINGKITLQEYLRAA
jgi:hypothetical protein